MNNSQEKSILLRGQKNSSNIKFEGELEPSCLNMCNSSPIKKSTEFKTDSGIRKPQNMGVDSIESDDEGVTRNALGQEIHIKNKINKSQAVFKNKKRLGFDSPSKLQQH